MYMYMTQVRMHTTAIDVASAAMNKPMMKDPTSTTINYQIE